MSIFMKNSKGEWVKTNAETLLASRKNKWQGWTCGIGTLKLDIKPNGDVYNGVCEVGGCKGNVFEGTLELENDWVTCTKPACSCGDDMMVRKFRPPRKKEDTYRLGTTEKDQIENENVVGPYYLDFHNTYDKTVTWRFSRRCNYYCQYCPSSVSNLYDEHRSWAELKRAVDTILDTFARENKIKFIILGGEPTINPSYLKLVKYIHSKGHFLHTTTNGSRKSNYYGELIKYSAIGLSVHFEFAKNQHIIDVVREIKKSKDEKVELADKNWFGIRLMVRPGHLAEAKNLAYNIREEFNNIDDWCEITLSSLYSALDDNELIYFNEDELKEIEKNDA